MTIDEKIKELRRLAGEITDAPVGKVSEESIRECLLDTFKADHVTMSIDATGTLHAELIYKLPLPKAYIDINFEEPAA